MGERSYGHRLEDAMSSGILSLGIGNRERRLVCLFVAGQILGRAVPPVRSEDDVIALASKLASWVHTGNRQPD